MDKDSIKDFLEKRYEELAKEELLPKLEKKREDNTPPKAKPEESILKKVIIYVIATSLFVGLIYFCIKVYDRWKINQADQTSVLLERLGDLTELPDSEIPTIATVTNANVIKNQLFFKEAQTGDKLIIYKESKKAILYRPSSNKVISIAPTN